jgi:hypothetical protein
MKNAFFTHKNIELSFALKLSQLHKEGLTNLGMDQFKHALYALKWREGRPQLLHELIEDVFSCSASEIVAYLAKQAIVEARTQSLADYADALGGNSK